MHATAAEFCKTIKVMVEGIKYFQLTLVPIMINTPYLDQAADVKQLNV